MMTSAILFIAVLSNTTAAQVGRRQPFGIYPGPSITSSSSSSSMPASYGGYSNSATIINTTSFSMSMPTATSIPVLNTTISSSLMTSIVSGSRISWTTNSNGTFVLGTPTISATDASSNTVATTTSETAPRETTCVAVAINNIGADGICGCDYDVYTCLERLSITSEWSISQTTASFNGCMQACDSQPTCYSFTFQISSGLCKMFGGMLNGGDVTVSAADFISGEVVKGTCTGHCDGQ